MLERLAFYKAGHPYHSNVSTTPNSARTVQINSTGTNGVTLTYGQNVVTAKEMSVDLDTGRVEARGQARLEDSRTPRNRRSWWL